MKTERLPPKLRKLFAVAKKARSHAYAPHSGCQVGAAIELESGGIYPGCNVENASYGGTVCAERGGIQTAICAEGKIRIKQILVVTDANPPWLPCGLCRQVISEFVANSRAGDIPIYSTNTKGDMIASTFLKLYPGLFSPSELKRGQARK